MAIFILVYIIIDLRKLTARAVMISRVTASGSGMCDVLAFALFFH